MTVSSTAAPKDAMATIKYTVMALGSSDYTHMCQVGEDRG